MITLHGSGEAVPQNTVMRIRQLHDNERLATFNVFTSQ